MLARLADWALTPPCFSQRKAEAELPAQPIRPVASEGSEALQRAEEEAVEDEEFVYSK